MNPKQHATMDRLLSLFDDATRGGDCAPQRALWNLLSAFHRWNHLPAMGPSFRKRFQQRAAKKKDREVDTAILLLLDSSPLFWTCWTKIENERNQ